jgi:activator of HSP90 ATPase
VLFTLEGVRVPGKYYLELLFRPCFYAATPNRQVGEKIMSDRIKLATRRQMIVRSALAFGALTTAANAAANLPQEASKQTSAAAPCQSRTSLHQEIEFKATPQRIYAAFLDSKQFASFTGLPAEIDPKAGGAFNMFGGLIVGRNVELLPNQRLVQAWRPAHWEPGVYSIVRFELKAQDPGSLLVFDHIGFPAEEYEHLSEGWPLRYWEPLKKFLASP